MFETNEGRLREDVRHQGYLYKTGPRHKSFDKRWCVLEHASLTYYLTEKSTTAKGSIDRQCIHGIQETSVDRQQYAFEISTNKSSNRLYLFAAENAGERNMWMQSLSKLISPVSIMEYVGLMEFSLGGNYYVKENISEDWRKSWLMLSRRLLYYMDQNQKLETVDLSKASSIKYQEMDRGCRKCTETGQHFVIHAPNRVLYIQADLVRDTEKVFAACEKAMEGRLREDVRHQGYLYKTGPRHNSFDKRWCVLEHASLTYYLTEKSTTAKGSIDRQCIHGIQETSVEKQQYAFEISTNKSSNRLYLFAAENAGERNMWMQSLSKLISPVSIMEYVGLMEFSLGGNYYVKENISEDWRKSWLMLSRKLLYYMDQNQKLETVDLRKASSIKYQEIDRGCRKCTETGQHFVINAPNRALYIQADLVRDTEKVFAACEKAMEESGRTLQDQQLTSDDVPVIVNKCIDAITTSGLKSTGIYRASATNSRVQQLLEELRKDARAVKMEDFTCNEVANALKSFFRELDDSLFTSDNYKHWIEIAAVSDQTHKLNWYHYLLDKLPMINYNTLKKLVMHLYRVSQFSSENRMSQENLATCFAPSLMRTDNMETGAGMEGDWAREIGVLTDIIKNHEFLLRISSMRMAVEHLNPLKFPKRT